MRSRLVLPFGFAMGSSRGGVAMNERDAYQLARPFTEVFTSRQRRYEYACVSIEAVRHCRRSPSLPTLM